MPLSVRCRLIVALLGCASLAGCVGDDPRFPSIGPINNANDARMPVVVDTYDHRVLHPVTRYPTGRVDPVDTRVGRHQDFGPEPAVVEPKPKEDRGISVEAVPPPRKPDMRGAPGPVSSAEPRLGRLIADLAALRRTSSGRAGAFLALAKPHKKTKVAKTEAEKSDADNAAADRIDTDLDAPGAADGERLAARRGAQDQDGGYRLNFEDAEVKDVLQAVMGRVLGLSYTIAPNVSGRITISSSAGQSRAELLATLETVLSMQGLSLTRSGNTYRVAPMTVGGGELDGAGEAAGFGISVVPLRYSSVASMNKLLGGFVTDADGIRIDAAHNAVIVRGPGPRRSEIVRAIKAFDGDWMHTQSVSMYELKRSRPEDIVPELTRIFASDKDGGAEGLIEFRPMKRLRSVMIISKNDALIRRAGAWIHRLDHQDTSGTSSIFVYRPQFRDARELTKLVNGLFGQSDFSAPGVSFQPNNGATGSGSSSSGFGSSSGSSSPGLSSGSSGGSGSTPGLSSASYAGGLSGGSFQGSSGGSSGGLGSSSGGGFGSSSSGSSFGGGSGSSGLKGDLADPIEAGESHGGGNEKLKLTADTSNNTVVAYTDGETYKKVRAIMQQLDVPPIQVAVNVIIAEVQLNDELKYGVQFFLNQSAKTAGSVGFSTSPTSIVSSVAQGAAAGVTQAISPTGGGFNFIGGGAASPNVIISALDQISKVHILSTPSIVVMENKPATLEVGNQVPVTTQQAQSNLTPDAPTVNSVTYVDTGIILKIIPRVGQNGNIDMQIDQEISNVVPDATGSTTASLTPTISNRRIASFISVKSGQNVLLAGLVTDTRSKSNGQVPFSGPLGNLLGNTDNSFSRTELVMFLRPVIVRNGQDAAEVTQDFRRNLSAMDVHAPPVFKP